MGSDDGEIAVGLVVQEEFVAKVLYWETFGVNSKEDAVGQYSKGSAFHVIHNLYRVLVDKLST